MNTPMDDNDRIIAHLASIDMTLRELLLLSKSKRAASDPANDADLDTQAGDEMIKFKPKTWTGDDYKGCRMSETTPEFLDALAASFAYFAKKNEENDERDAKGRTKAHWDKQSERRARGWASRLRAGFKPKPKTIEPMSADEVRW